MFTVPNAADAAFSDQAQLDKVDLDMLVAGAAGDGVVSGCAVTQQGTPDMTVAVAGGLVRIAGKTITVSAGNVTIGSNSSGNPRFDLITVNSSGTKAATPGTAAAAPVFPAIPAGSVVLAAVRVASGATSIVTDRITDKRVSVIKGTVIASTGSSYTIDATAGTSFDLTLTADATLSLSGGPPGPTSEITVLVRQDSTGHRGLVWPTSVKWLGDTPPSFGSLPSKVAGIAKLYSTDGGANWVAQFIAGQGLPFFVIPLYTYPSFFGSDWDTFDTYPARAVIANVGSGAGGASGGPGASYNSDWAREISSANANGMSVLGYVDTSYAARSMTNVKADIDSWYSNWSGSGTYAIKGIFFDLTPTTNPSTDGGVALAYVQEACAYVRSKSSAAQLVVCNPGAYPLVAEYIDAADVTCVLEADYTANSYLTMTVPAWATAYVAAKPASKFLHLVYNVANTTELGLAQAHAASMKAGWFYATSTNSNWGALPSYYATEWNSV